MDTALQTLLSWQFVMLCLGIAAITFVVRKIGYFLINYYSLKKLELVWGELIMPILPVVLGGSVAGLISKYPFPEVVSTLSGRVFFGLVAGMLSGLVYRVTKSMIAAQVPKNKKEDPQQNNQ
jgi:hypothetical protein